MSKGTQVRAAMRPFFASDETLNAAVRAVVAALRPKPQPLHRQLEYLSPPGKPYGKSLGEYRSVPEHLFQNVVQALKERDL